MAFDAALLDTITLLCGPRMKLPTREVLGHAADECDEELSPAPNAALLDTITLLCGPRMKLPIYGKVLQRLSLVQKLNVRCKLAREVLGHAADECDEELSPALYAALLDTITLLCGLRMKLPKKPEKNSGDADIDDLQERVTTNIVSHKMKRTVAEVLVPAVLRLYGRLRARGGQVAAYLVRIATDLLNDYRHEIEELIENDEELVERVRQFQETIGQAPSFGNARNLVTASAPPEPETPRAPRRRYRGAAAREPPRKRALNI
ncbi:uncharacterized protein LOC114363037 [Ostrinia furnacalis]|uniref:uncharacterized protein LOC114363037 n=1 Tax=Ostrinia furnacalis TaxID=93504 RepID=UPI00103F99CF|nr:uncharacterized protein LOC114363037 [Ostrinia furnacalis]